MQFLNPWLAIGLAAGAFPLLLLLYFLKLRRERVTIPSTLLWIRSFEDLQVNAPFQRLRWSWLLLIHILLLILLLAAASRPVIEGDLQPSERVIMLIDVSASMQTRDGAGDDAPTRLERARTAALEYLDALDSQPNAETEVMIAAFGATPSIVSGFETSMDRLRRAIESVRATDEEANLAAALQLAGAFASRGGSEGSDDTAPPVVLVLTDGGVAPPESRAGFTLRAGTMQMINVGPEQDAAAENIGISALSAQRAYDDPDLVRLFVRLVNAGPEEIQTTVTVTPAEGAPSIRQTTIPGATDESIGERALTFEFIEPDTTLFVARHLREDALSTDNDAAIVVPAVARPRVLVVHPDDGDDDAINGPLPALMELLNAFEPDVIDTQSATAFASEDPGLIDAASLADFIVFDRVAPARLPGVPSLTIGALPTGFEARDNDADRGRRLLSWNRQHPVLRHVNLDNVLFTGFPGMDVPTGAEVLATTDVGPAIAELKVRGAEHIVVGFSGLDDRRSNWALDVSVTIFLENVLGFVGASQTGGTIDGHRPGSVTTVRAGADAEVITLTGPGGERVEVAVDNRTTVALPRQPRAGVYAVSGATIPGGVLALSVLSDVESDVRGRGAIAVNATAAPVVASTRRTNLELWPWFIAAALLLLVAEWIVYCWKLAGPDRWRAP